jgi:high affinity Mn2+ porin
LSLCQGAAKADNAHKALLVLSSFRRIWSSIMRRYFLPLLLLVPGPAFAADAESWALHGQATIIEQYHPGFRSPYRGTNSMDPGSRGDETVTATLYGGLRAWDGGEAWADGEIDQGFGLSDTLGAAGFTNGEGSKVGKALPYFRLHRLFFRQSFDLGGEMQDIAPAPNQLGGRRSADNVVLTLGKFSATDIFDTNTYAHDPSQDFLNWAIMDAGAFDYAADAWGYSYGAAGEWNTGDWSFRAGLFDMSRLPNGTELVRGFGQYQIDAEIERRFQLSGRDGKIKFLGWMSRANMGSYNAATALALVSNQPANIALVRRPASRPGGSINAEQGLTDDLGFFLRASLADGSKESYEFTDIDRSVSGGLSWKGVSWGRNDDTVGLALEDAALSQAGLNFLGAGGLGILVGDDRLIHAGDEKIVETYYNAALWDAFAVTLDYQFITNPAYNADRGPISVLGVRLHSQF